MFLCCIYIDPDKQKGAPINPKSVVDVIVIKAKKFEVQIAEDPLTCLMDQKLYHSWAQRMEIVQACV